jgi:hypothetical protein
MWWLIAWAALSILSFVALVFLVAAVPTTEEVRNGELIKLLALAIGGAGVVVALAYAGASVFMGIF